MLAMNDLYLLFTSYTSPTQFQCVPRFYTVSDMKHVLILHSLRYEACPNLMYNNESVVSWKSAIFEPRRDASGAPGPTWNTNRMYHCCREFSFCSVGSDMSVQVPTSCSKYGGRRAKSPSPCLRSLLLASHWPPMLSRGKPIWLWVLCTFLCFYFV